MFNTTKRVFAIALALVLVFSLAGCSKPTGDGSSVEYIIEEDVQYVGGSGGTTGGNNSTGTNSTGGNNSTGGTTSTGTTTNSTVDLEKLKGTTVKFASTIDPKNDGTQSVIDSFTKKYGINVKIVSCSLDTYIAEMQILINNGESPDVGRSNGDFPACVAYFDSLDKAKIDFDDPIWNQTTFKMSTFNGKPYMCETYGDYWTELDMTIFSKSALENAGFTEGVDFPMDLYNKGEWTWSAFLNIAKECSKTSGKAAGYASYEAALHTCGASVYTVKDEKIVSGLNDSKAVEVMKSYAQARKDGYINNKGISGIATGDTAIVIDHAWNLRNDSDMAATGIKKADIGFCYLPSWEKGGATPATGIFRGFGVIRGAKNPEGAGVFLRHYLDVENYDTESAFINEEAKTFFFKLTGQDYGENYNPYLTYIGLNTAISGIDYNTDVYSAMYADPSAVESKMASVRKAAQQGADELNSHIQKYVYSN